MDVDRGRCSGMAKPRCHDRDRDAGVEHLRRHDVTEIVEPKCWSPKWDSVPSVSSNRAIQYPKPLTMTKGSQRLLTPGVGCHSALRWLRRPRCLHRRLPPER